jgi:hypothetical protein
MKNNRKFQNLLMLLFFLGLLIPMMSSCAKEKKARVQRGDAASEDTMTEDTSQKEVVVVPQSDSSSGGQTAAKTTSSSSAKSSANPFEGTWDVNFGGTFTNWTFGYASKDKDKLEGKITDSTSNVIGEYIVYPNKTVELTIYSASTPAIVPYKISNGGNQIEVNDGTTKVTLTKGKTNTTIQNDGTILASHGIWTNINNPSDQIQFSSVRKSSSGWNGNVSLTGGSGTFSLTPGKITFRIAGGSDTYTYKLRNSNSTLDLTDASGTETYK